MIGSGAAGLAAAVTAAALHRRVLLLEATDRVGGTTAVSGGMVWIPANHHMRDAGVQDSLDAAWRYLRETVPGCGHDPRMAAFLARGDEAVRFLEGCGTLRLRPVRRYPDYYPEAPGATAGGRVLEPVPFDGRLLGGDFARLRDPLPEFMLFGGMMISREDLPVLRKCGRSPRAAWHVARLLARYALQRLRAHRGTQLVLGNALVARLFKSARDLGVRIELQTPALGLRASAGRIDGVQVERGGRRQEIGARHGVILATGGLSHHPGLRAEHVPAQAGTLSAAVASGVPDGGIQLATRVGAQRSRGASGVDDALAFWVPGSTFRRADGSLGVFPHTVTDRAKPGLIAVDWTGRRFVNEAVSYHEFVRAQLREPQSAIPAWLVCDRRFLWQYGLGRVRPFALSTRAEVASGYLRRAGTLAQLADAIGVPREAFLATVARYNEGAREGRDPEFGRGSTIYQQHLGDAEQQPNPCVRPIGKGPYYAVAVVPADLGMAAGLRTNEHAQVLRADGTPIPGLYACGNDMHSVMEGHYPGPGITLGPALVFGYIAARHAIG